MKKEFPGKPLGRTADARSCCSSEARDLLPTLVPYGKEGKEKSQKMVWCSGTHLERQTNVETWLATTLSSRVQ